MRISTLLINQLGINGILNQQARLSQIQAKLATGKRILSPADDPSGSAQLIRLTQSKTLTEQYIRNSIQVVNRQTSEEAVLASVENSLLRLRELAIQANSSTLDNSSRHAIGQEVRQRVDEIFGLANSKDTNGKYLFAGYQVNQKPFSRQADGSFSYNADQGQRLIQISSQRRIADGDSGLKVFMDIGVGNGRFQIMDNPANTGSGIIDPGIVADFSAYVADTYTITIVTNGNGKLAYNVVGAATGQLIPPLPQDPVIDAPDYSPEAAIVFNGIETSITGAPAAGDTFTVSPATKQDIFSIANDLAVALETDAEDAAAVAKVLNAVARSFQNIDNAFEHITEFRTIIGARLNTIEDQQAVNESFLIELQATASQIQDLDMVSAITELQARTFALQAAQASFIRIQGLSIFNFL